MTTRFLESNFFYQIVLVFINRRLSVRLRSIPSRYKFFLLAWSNRRFFTFDQLDKTFHMSLHLTGGVSLYNVRGHILYH